MLVLAWLALGPSEAPRAATSTVDFETGPPIGTAINDEYAATAFVFWQRSDPGFRPYRRTAGVPTHSGTVAADISPTHCYPGEEDSPSACEFVAPSTVARLTRPASGVTLYAGLFAAANDSVSVTLRAYNAAGAPVGSTTAPIGVGITTPLTVSSPAADIARFDLIAEGPGKPGAELGFDDLAIQIPDGPLSPRGCFGGSTERNDGAVVTSAASLDRLLRSGFTGRIIIPHDTQMPMVDDAGNPLREIPVGSGVEIVGERGPLGTRPLLYTNVGAPDGADKTASVFTVTGDNVRIEGLHFRGPKSPESHAKHDQYFSAITVFEDADPGDKPEDAQPDVDNGRNVVIADNEFERWSHAGVLLIGDHGSVRIEDWEKGWKFLEPKDVRLVRIERNYMHHNVMDGGGYGVKIEAGAYAYIAGNVFDTNRHAVATSGRAYSGYEIRFNYVLEGGLKQGGFYNQHFDVHGSGDKDYGGYAGEWFKIANNTIRGEQDYYLVKTRAAFMLRGKPAQGAWFDNNVAVHDDLDEAVDLKGSHGSTGIGESHKEFNFHASGNKFDTDYTKEVAAGDFDGDGCSDVFVATGTGWFFSRTGTQPWEFLKDASTRTGDLGFADIDNDRVTDVVDQRPNGKLRYLKLGPGPAASLPSSPVPVKDLRFGDFDGDGLTDIFYTRKGEWHVWYGSTHAWSDVQTSSTPISEMLFGFFDDVPGTDVAAVRNKQWSYSSGAIEPWAKLNDKLRSSFKNAVAADFDGNGKTDIAFSDGSKWRYSPDGRAPLALLRKGASALDRMITGRFSAPPTDPNAPIPAQVVAWNSKGLKLILWSGLGTGDAFGALSHQDMR